MIEPAAMNALGTIAAFAVTASAGYVSAKVRQIAQGIEEAQEKAQENRELLAGDPDAGPSVFDRLDRIESTLYDRREK